MRIIDARPMTAGGGLYGAYACVRDQKASGTVGGSYNPANAWQRRDLNTEVADTADLVAVAANQITLQPGSYRVEARAAFQYTGASRIRLQDVTNGVTLVLGDSGGDNLGGGGYTVSGTLPLSGRFTLAAQATLELQMRCQAVRDTWGCGAPVGTGDPEVYASVELWREGNV